MFDEIYGPEVRVTNVQYSCRHIYWMIESRERIELTPDFQRRQVWSNKQRSELIESILLGIPIPVIYLFESQFGTWQVLDGLQRLSAITDFMSGRFRLNGLTVLAELNGFVYEESRGQGERRDRYLFQIEYEQLDNKEVKECLGKLENHQELVYIT